MEKQMGKKIKGSEYGLENITLILNCLVKSKYIHYGYFHNDLETEFWNFGKAQQAYTDKLLSLVPKGVKTILDVGCGTGMVAKLLKSNGYQVECISPSTFLTQKVKDNDPGLTVYECKFEDFKPPKKYDLLLFCESYQYIKLNDLFKKLSECVTRDGYLMLSDIFKTNPNNRGPIGGGHLYNDHIEICARSHYTLIADMDITENISPTFDLLQNIQIQLLKPLLDNTIRVMSINKPIISKILLKVFHKKLARLNEKLTRENRNGDGFKEFNTYRMQVWQNMFTEQ